MIAIFKEIYEYREMIAALVKRDLKGRYKGSVLGFFWTLLNPLLQMCVYTIVFSIIMRNNIEKYYLFLFVALVPWMFFSVSLTGGTSCIVGQSNMINKIYFPREVLPISHVTSQFVNMLLSFLAVFFVLIVTGYGVNPLALIYLPAVMAVEYMLSLGFAMLLSAATVYFRDLDFLMGILTMAWQFLTPIMYSETLVPDSAKPIFNLNPMTSVISVYRDILYYKEVPEISTLTTSFIMGILVLVVGWALFRRLQKGFAEVL